MGKFMNERLNNFFKKQSLNNKIGHAYLIANTSFEDIYNDLNIILSNYIFKNSIDLKDNQDVIFVNPENDVIKKNQILELKSFLKSTSQISGKKVYIINHTEVLNASSANSLLKLLEEPEKNIFAFLITTNINGVLKTIKSRCQIIFLSTEENKILNSENEDIYNEALQLVELIEKYKNSYFPYVYQSISKKGDKNHTKSLLENLINIYNEILKIKLLGLNSDYTNLKLKNISSLMSEPDIIRKLIIINRFLIDTNYNLNNSLFYDKFLIELGGMK